MHRRLEKTQSGQVIETDQRDIPDHTTSCSVYKVDEEEGESGSVCGGGACLPKSKLHVMGCCSPGDGWTSACAWEAMN